MNGEAKGVLEELEPLLRKAEQQGLWLQYSYQGIAFSPAELREHHAHGRFVWGSVNWRLVDPITLSGDLAKRIADTQAAKDALEKRMQQAQREAGR